MNPLPIWDWATLPNPVRGPALKIPSESGIGLRFQRPALKIPWVWDKLGKDVPMGYDSISIAQPRNEFISWKLDCFKKMVGEKDAPPRESAACKKWHIGDSGQKSYLSLNFFPHFQ